MDYDVRVSSDYAAVDKFYFGYEYLYISEPEEFSVNGLTESMAYIDEFGKEDVQWCFVVNEGEGNYLYLPEVMLSNKGAFSNGRLESCLIEGILMYYNEKEKFKVYRKGCE